MDDDEIITPETFEVYNGKTFFEFFVDDDELGSNESEGCDDILTQTVAKLSIHEREECIHDLYGIRENIDETPNFVKDKLDHLAAEISNVKKSSAYNKAYRQSPQYVDDLRLMFLRCDRFDATKAAHRMVGFFQKKELLFGKEKLTKDIELSDFDEESMAVLKSGCCQILPSRDRSGRLILLYAMRLLAATSSSPIEDLLRTIFYVTMSALKDEDVQKAGTVIVCSYLGPCHSMNDFPIVAAVNSLKNCLPDRNDSVHMCCPRETIFYPIMKLSQFLSPPHIQARTREHFGSLQEINYDLSTYGIPNLPLEQDGSCSVESHMAWLNDQRRKEATGVGGIIAPQRFDVLFGRGKGSAGHTGNLRAGYLIELRRKEYEQAGKLEKTRIASEIVEMIHESKGRFLKKQNGVWVEVDDGVARDKVSHFFRNLRGKEYPKNCAAPKRGKSEDGHNLDAILDPASSTSPRGMVTPLAVDQS